MANNYSPEVAAILETLRQLGPPQSQHQVQSHTAQYPATPPVVQQPGPAAPQHPPRLPQAPSIDPTTITTWPPALRHVLKTIATNEQIVFSIRRVYLPFKY